MKPSIPTEAEVLRQCLAYLALRGIRAWRNNTGAALLPGRGGKPQMVRFGQRGSPDILGILSGGRLLACEVKRPGKQPREDQAAWLKAASEAGALAGCVHSVEELQQLLEGKN